MARSEQDFLTKIIPSVKELARGLYLFLSAAHIADANNFFFEAPLTEDFAFFS